MLRLSLLALALLLVAPAGAAQSPPADEPGTYFVLGDPSLGVGAAAFTDYSLKAELGRRFGSGLEAGLIGRIDQFGRGQRSMTGGLTSALTRAAPGGTIARLRGTALYTSHENAFAAATAPGAAPTWSSVTGDLSATLGRSVPVAGSLRVEPTVGAYASVYEVLRHTSAPVGDVGLQLEAPVRARLLGVDASLVPAMRISALRDHIAAREVLPTLGLRLDF